MLPADPALLSTKQDELWSTVLTKNILVYPDPAIVSYFAKTWPNKLANTGKRALDIGFGSGRHFSLLKDYGFTIFGIEVSTLALTEGNRMLHQLGVTGTLLQTSLEENPFPDEHFDVLIYWGTVFFSPLAEMRHCLAQCRRILKKNGGLVLNFRTPESWTYGLGREVTAGTFELDERAGPYKGMTYTFLDDAQCRAFLSESGFIIDNAERIDHWKDNIQYRHSWNIYWAHK